MTMKNVIKLPIRKTNHKDVAGMNLNRNAHFTPSHYMEEDFNTIDESGSEEDMTGKLYWRPIVNNEKPFDKRLKWILQEEGMVNRHLTVRDVPFLKGIRAARPDIEADVEHLIAALEKFGLIELYVEEDIESPN